MNVSAEAVLVILVLVIAVGLLLAGWLSSSAASERAREANLREQVVRADARVTRDHQAARRAMNDAAGQSWRNQFE